MLLWTIQHVDAWHALQSTGVLRGDPRFTYDYFLNAYHWMFQQMRQYIGPPPCPHTTPVWAWYQWGTVKHPEPDLHVYATHLPKGTERVCIECVVADHRVLLSDFDLWHHVLNSSYLPHSEEDDQIFEEEENRYLAPEKRICTHIPIMYQYAYPPHLREKIITSWQRIFDLEWEEEYCTYKREEKSIQATLWELSLDDVKRVQKFVAR